LKKNTRSVCVKKVDGSLGEANGKDFAAVVSPVTLLSLLQRPGAIIYCAINGKHGCGFRRCTSMRLHAEMHRDRQNKIKSAAGL
jgi:hypothetical protein